MIFRHRSFLLLMTGEMIACTGLWVSIIGNLSFMQHLVPSDFLKGLILMSGMLVSILFSPKAGVVIDRYDKRRIMLIAILLRCISPLCMFPALAHDSIAWMVASLIIMQTSDVFYFPAVQAAIPAILPPGELMKANSVYMIVATLSRIGGTALGGIMAASMELSSLYTLSIIAYAFLAIVTLCLHIPQLDQGAVQQRETIQFREIFTQMRKEPAVIVGLVNLGMITLFLGGFNLLVLQFSQFQQRPELMGWIYSVEGTSILVAGLAAKRLIGERNLVATSTWLVCVFALAEFGMSVAGNLYVVLGSFALFGATVAFFFPAITTIFQKRLPEHTHGRFFSFRDMYERTLFLVAVATTGACLDLLGIARYMLCIGGITLLCAGVMLVYGKRKRADVRPPGPVQPPVTI
ncbi:MFS transporter [Brevibacillus sp. SYP-B805]|uniref:MFS transporter n=1 Tax=Brevibacillus sp. SYP-B805 TaxID=1578199 RepID=UPI0013EB9438|nr:MFS transporter [Brevibacillus sp. SYP-B805]